jgi:hypothetical protein
LNLIVRVHQLGESMQYRVLAISAPTLPGRELILEMVGHQLATWEVNGRPFTGPSANAIVAWLAQALEARFRAEDVAAAATEDERAVLQHLVQVTSANSPESSTTAATSP